MSKVLPTILFINKKIPHLLSFKAGGEISIQTILLALRNQNFSVYSIGTVKDTGGFPNLYHSIEDVLKESNRRQYTIEKYVKRKFIELILQYPILIYDQYEAFSILRDFINNHPNTIIMTQLNGSEEILRASLQLSVPIILFIRDPVRKEDLLCLQQIKDKNKKIWVIFNSHFTSKAKRFNRIRKFVHTSVVYPPIDTNKFTNINNSNACYVTLVNPTLIKGGRIFMQLASAFPKVQFLAVQGWYDPTHENLHLRKLKNVVFWPSQEDIRRVFKVTKILLFPSQWQEPFGRVAAEALASGLPVLASFCGGLSESLGHNAHFVKHYHTIGSWQSKLNYLLNNPDVQIKYKNGGKIFVKKFDTKIVVGQVISVINNLYNA